MMQHHNLEPQVFAVTPRRASWALDKNKTMWVTRTGFPLVPDFASTVHGVTGRTLNAAVADLKPFYKKPNQEDALMGYICLSRVAKAENFVLAQAFPPMLFRQGPQPGPQLLIEFLRGNVQQEDLQQRWADIEKAKTTAKNELKDLQWQCCRCEQTKKVDDFTTANDNHKLQSYRERILEPGHWRVCKTCSTAGRVQKILHSEYWCSMCQAMRPREEFDDEHLLQIERRNRARDRHCKRHTESKISTLAKIVVSCAICGETTKTKDILFVFYNVLCEQID